MGLLSGKEDDLNAGLALEKMMNQFNIDLDEEIDETEEDNERINRRRNKKKKERE